MKHTLKTLLTTTVLILPSVFGAGLPESGAQSGTTPYTTATEAEAEAELAKAIAEAEKAFKTVSEKFKVAKKAAKEEGPEAEALLRRKVEGFPPQLAEALKEIAKKAPKK
jgi:hypothetical protein